mmetsp:Transcript_12793/g.51337  ORF Transcript_12793/g.51337 Transcript_12793/m.51337 type:complete len:117 (-) Transcript_12793:1173-1523(-)
MECQPVHGVLTLFMASVCMIRVYPTLPIVLLTPHSDWCDLPFKCRSPAVAAGPLTSKLSLRFILAMAFEQDPDSKPNKGLGRHIEKNIHKAGGLLEKERRFGFSSRAKAYVPLLTW